MDDRFTNQNKMNEFRNRMDSQREVLGIVNKSSNWTEELCGLSDSSISRWLQVNSLPTNSRVAELLRQISEKLFFLATKSQEQVTEDYKALSKDLGTLANDLKIALG